jgi:hypothetical protein
MRLTQEIIRDSFQYFQNDYLFFTDKKNNKTDSLEVAVDFANPSILLDLTDSFHLPWPVFQVITRDEEGRYDNQFMKYSSGRLREPFQMKSLDSTGVHLQKKDEKTLSGTMVHVDEVVHWYENGYPFTIDLDSFDLTRIDPDIHYIGFHTFATQSFKAHMVINGQVDEQLMDVAAGDSVIIDTLYRKLQKVRIRVANSVQLEIKVETVKNKIKKAIDY